MRLSVVSTLVVLNCVFQMGNSYPSKTLCRPEDGYFRCLTRGGCIDREMVRNYEWNCRDDSDDTHPPLTCTDDEFRCRFSLKCTPRYLINTERSCRVNESLVLPCRENEFACALSKICIPRWMVMNGVRNCDGMLIKDDSDEKQSLPFCLPSEFSCLSKSNNSLANNSNSSSLQCIPREWVADGVKDCANARDEALILSTCNNATEFRCEADQRCIARYRVVDGYRDCTDGSDELRSLQCDPSREFRCTNGGRCIPRSWRGNKMINCKDGSDEVAPPSNETCVEGEFHCHNKKRCIPRYLLCDGMDHCGDCSDEIESCPEPRMFRCQTDPKTCVFRTYSCDEYQDCPGRADDFRNLPGFKCYKSVFGITKNVNYCVLPQWSLQDNYAMCNDDSDLCYTNGSFNCAKCLQSNMTIAKRQVCDGVFDCPDLSDECLCSRDQLSANRSRDLCDQVCYGETPTSTVCAKCVEGEIECPQTGGCISRKQVCDGIVDCSISKSDERNCGGDILATNTTLASDFLCDVIAKNFAEIAKLVLDSSLVDALLPINAKRCDGKVECALFEDECSDRANCSEKPAVCDQISIKTTTIPAGFFPVLNFTYHLRSRKCSGKMDFIFGSNICNGVVECNEGFDEMNCSNLFHCQAGPVQTVFGVKTKTAIPEEKLCNLTPDCDDWKDELNCSKSTHFYCTDKKPLFVPRDKVQDGVVDCEDGSDECPPEYLQNDALASNTQMIKWRALEILVWFMAVLALLGNLAVFVQTCVSLRKRTTAQNRQRLGLINRVLILNLAVSDFIMGVALLIIGIKAVQFSGEYCIRDKAWRSSNLCDIIGVLTVLSSETSVLTLVCITSYRLFSVFNPMTSRNLRLRIAVMWIVTIWLGSFAVSVLPFIPALSSSMVSKIQIRPIPYFPTDTVVLSELQTFAGRLSIISNKSQPQTDLWNSNWFALESFLGEFDTPVPSSVSSYGYYSSSSVCIPRLYRIEASDSVNAMSSVIITFNFVALLYIACAYGAIYWISQRRSGIVQGAKPLTKKNNQTKALQLKVTILIATDLCCWLPICIMTFLSMGGAILSPMSYAISAILLLPINSSLNPLIYSSLPQVVFKKLRTCVLKSRKRLSSIAFRRHSHVTNSIVTMNSTTKSTAL